MTKNEVVLAVVAGFFALILAANKYASMTSLPPGQTLPLAPQSVPYVAPPKCDCTCSTQGATKPFTTQCPYCRTILLVTPPRTGEVGASITVESRPEAPKK